MQIKKKLNDVKVIRQSVYLLSCAVLIQSLVNLVEDQGVCFSPPFFSECILDVGCGVAVSMPWIGPDAFVLKSVKQAKS